MSRNVENRTLVSRGEFGFWQKTGHWLLAIGFWLVKTSHLLLAISFWLLCFGYSAAVQLESAGTSSPQASQRASLAGPHDYWRLAECYQTQK
jgi:hypothetical protein